LHNLDNGIEMCSDCTEDKSEVNPKCHEKCHSRYCYVDAEKCRNSTEMVYTSDSFPFLSTSLHFSYTTCGSKDFPPSSIAIDTSGGKMVKGTVVGSEFPLQYKLDDGLLVPWGGPQVFNDSIPWSGLLINYLNDLNQDVIEIELISPTGGSMVSGHSYDSSIKDIESGISSFGVGLFWVTTERLQRVAYSAPILWDKFFLVIERPAPNTALSFQIQKILKPFTVNLWFVIIGTIFLMTGFSIWFAGADDSNPTRWQTFRNKKWKEGSLLKRVRVVLRLYFETFLETSNYCFGQAIEQDFEATLEYKVVMMGFGLLILIIASAYFANLAAFLTLPGVANYIGTMEQAIAQNARICIPGTVGFEANQTWPDANFVYIADNDDYGPLLQAYEDGQCDLAAIGSITPEGNLDKMCELNLTITSSLVITVAVAIPLSQEISREFSYSLYTGEDFGTIYDFKKPRPTCNLEFDVSQTASATTALTPENLILPFIILAVCAMSSYVLSIFPAANTRNIKDATDHSKVASSTEKEIVHLEKIPKHLKSDEFHEAKLTKNIETQGDVAEEFSELLDKMADNGIDSTSNIIIVPILVDKHKVERKELVMKYLSEIEQALKEE